LSVRVAAAQYVAERSLSSESLHRKLDSWVAEAAANGARLAVFPEFSAIEFALLRDRRITSDRRSPDRHKLGPLPVMAATRRIEPSLEWETAAIQFVLDEFIAIHADLAVRHEIYILAGTIPFRDREECLRNRAYFFTPEGTVGHQDKIVPTRWERQVWGITGGRQIKTFETKYWPIGIAICYDIEFPLVARLQAEAGARIVLAPCCCDSMRGYHRVRIGARARAMENQAYIIQSPMIGDASWSGVIGTSVGAAGIYGPPDLGSNVNGVIAQGQPNKAMWIYADLDLAALERVRGRSGAIANESEWKAHLSFVRSEEGALGPPVKMPMPTGSSPAERA
jgi:predicted amidohydrolase